MGQKVCQSCASKCSASWEVGPTLGPIGRAKKQAWSHRAVRHLEKPGKATLRESLTAHQELAWLSVGL